jgi:hypothetical protein
MDDRSESVSRRTQVVHCKRGAYDIYIGRPGKWGNPFVIGKDGTREEVIEKYRAWLLSREDLMGSLPELQGKTLGCWCKPEACHGDVLAELADGRARELEPKPERVEPKPAQATEVESKRLKTRSRAEQDWDRDR